MCLRGDATARCGCWDPHSTLLRTGSRRIASSGSHPTSASAGKRFRVENCERHGIDAMALVREGEVGKGNGIGSELGRLDIDRLVEPEQPHHANDVVTFGFQDRAIDFDLHDALLVVDPDQEGDRLRRYLGRKHD